MKLDDVKKDIPETPEFIHRIVLEEVQKQIEKNEIIVNLSEKKEKRKWKVIHAAAVVLACIIGGSTIIYAGAKLYEIITEKQGKYSVETKIEKETTSEEKGLPEEMKEVTIEMGYIPEGMEWRDELYISYKDTPMLGGFSFDTVLLDSNDFGKALTDVNVVESEKGIWGGHEGIYLQYQDLEQDGSFNQRMYLLYPEEYRVLIMYIGDDVSKEEAIKVAENISLVETERVVKIKDMYTWSEFISPETDTGEVEITTKVSKNELKVFDVGEAFQMECSGENEAGEYISVDDISVKVHSVQTADDLSLLDEKLVQQEWKDAVGSDGKLVDNTLSYIKKGDGIETLDEVVKTETVKQKLVYVTVTYQNNSDFTINHMMYLGNIMLLQDKDEKYSIYNPCSNSEKECDYVEGNSVARATEMRYGSVRENYGGSNYIPSLQPGESIEVSMAWIVNENDLDKMYLNLSTYGGNVEFTEGALKTGVVDIRQ